MALGRTVAWTVGVIAAMALHPGWTLAAPAQTASVRVTYGLWLGGLPLGSADMVTAVDGAAYTLNLQARLTGLAGMITGGKGAASASGSAASGQPAPSSFNVLSQTSSDRRTVRVGFSGGAANAVEIAPPLEERPDRVPVLPLHKRGVVDPLSAVLMPMARRGELTDPENCNRTVPVFDGASRFDVILSYAETRQVEKPGYSGPVLVCNVRYRPVSGHRPDRPAVRYMEENRDMWVWLAPVEGTRVLIPMRISVATTMGVSLVEATRWAVEGAAGPTARVGRGPSRE
jgi:hypothetical protein